MATPTFSLETRPRRFYFLFIVALVACAAAQVRAGDVTWDNGAATSSWNISDVNWSGSAWNNANGDGATFSSTGAGAINVNAPINVNSLNFMVNGYNLGGTGPLTFVDGSSTLGTGFISVNPNRTAVISTPISSSLGLLKFGGGTLQLSGPITFSGQGFPLAGSGASAFLPIDIYVAGASGVSAGGTLQINNSSVLPSTARVGISNGLMNLGANNVTLGALTFINQADFSVFNSTTNSAGTGIIGSGTLKVNGEINVLSEPSGNNGSNTIAANLNLGGGTQIFRVACGGLFLQWGALQLMGSLSNGSLLKTGGYFAGGGGASAMDGMGLFGNNTYTGSTRINGGASVVTGTNASTFVEVSGQQNACVLSLQGANGSYLSATTIQVVTGGAFQIDNNSGVGGSGSFSPTIAAAQNNNRLADNVDLQLRGGIFNYFGRANAVATETIGKLTLVGGDNWINLTPNGLSGTVAVTVGGNLSMASRSALSITSATAFGPSSLGASSKLFVNGTLPAADATGILPRILSNVDFLTYVPATGLTPYTGYATNFSTPGTNVAVTAASTVGSSVNINALKADTSGGPFTTTIAAGQTLGINSGMILDIPDSNGDPATYTGGTIAFGSAPGAFFGFNTVSSAITGTNGLLNSAGMLELDGDLSGLTGTITQNNVFGVLNLNTNTFKGALEVREGQLNINTNQTLAGQGAITIGVPTNDSDLIPGYAGISTAGAPDGAVMGRDIIVNDGFQSVGGVTGADMSVFLLPALSPLNNTAGSQTWSGNITLNGPTRFQGGGGGGTGATNFTGNISGTSFLNITNGRAVFSGNLSNAGGFVIGRPGFTADVTFKGTVTGTAPITYSAGNNNKLQYTSGSLPTGTITVINPGYPGPTQMFPLDSSTINNPIVLSADIGANVAGGINATWAGQITGAYGLVKNGAGTLTLSNPNNTYSGNTTINAGTLVINGPLQVNTGQVIDLTGGTLTLNNSVVNNGLFVVSDGAHLAGSGASFINNGVLDIMTAGNFTFPPGFVNNGTILDSSVVRTKSAQKSGSTFTTTIASYSYHTYQLQVATSPGGTFTNVGSAQQGSTGSVLTFSDPNASGTTGFYHIAVN